METGQQQHDKEAALVTPEPTTQTPPTPPAPPRRRTRGKTISLVLVIALLCAAIGFGGGWLAVWFDQQGTSGSAIVEEMVGADGSTIVTTDEELISQVASRVSPSVVSIVTTAHTPGMYRTAQGAGTGVILSKNGYIMTNNHVIDNATEVSVLTSDGIEYSDVEVVGSDPLNDIAFLKIRGVSDLPPAQLGDSSKVRIGQRVVAIGNALGQFQNTVTSGIVSATGRPLVASSSNGQDSEQLTDLIQTDAAINSGNSGGPLVDLSGRVIGINTAVATDANGIGFAIPINATRGVMNGVLEDGEVSRAYLGVRYIDITPEIATDEDLAVRRGAYVPPAGSSDPIASGSPADEAGVKPGDIIVRVNDHMVGEHSNMSSIIGQYRPGDKVTLLISRDGKEVRLEATLAAYRD